MAFSRLVFTAPRYASAVCLYAVIGCPSVRPSVTIQSGSIETIGRIKLVFGTESTLFTFIILLINYILY